MLRIRTGRRWTRERSPAPHDSVSLELDGVALVSGAVEEPLLAVMESLLGGTRSLARGAALVDVPLPESGLVLCLDRTEEGCTLRVATTARPARLIRRVRLDWAEWAEGVERAGATFLEDLSSSAVASSTRRALRERLRDLEGPVRRPPRIPPAPLGLRVEPRDGRGLRVELGDASGLLERAPRGSSASLGALLGSGALSLVGAQVGWQLEGPVLLHVLELVRCGEDVARALGSGTEALELRFPGSSSRVALDHPAWSLGGGVVPWEAAEVARALLLLGTDTARAVRWAFPTAGKNPYLLDVVTRAEAALALLRPASARGSSEAPAAVRPTRRPPRPLRREGGLRRLRFVPVLEAAGVAGPGPTTLTATEPGALLVSDRGLDAFTWDGSARTHRVARRGAALDPSGRAVLATRDRLLAFPFHGANARWFQPHDGAGLDSSAVPLGQLLLVSPERRSLRALASETGHEQWVFAPPRTRRLRAAAVGSVVLAASESGVLTGLDMVDGTVRYRVAAPLPFTAAPLAWGALALVGMGRDSRSALLAVDPLTGEVRWLTELGLEAPLPAAAAGARAWVAGLHDGRPTLVCLDVRGKLLWRRALPTPERPAGILTSGVDVIVTGTAGSAARVRRNGRTAWRLGGAATAVTTVAPLLERGVLLVPGESLRAVDPRTGRVLAELPGGRGIRALAVGPGLEVARLDEAGDLTLHRLASHFAVVDARGG
jgi:outer membrane protein assembly factor BamB